MTRVLKRCNSHIFPSRNTLCRIGLRIQASMSPAIISFPSLHTQSLPRPAWVFYSVWTVMLMRISRLLTMRPYIGLTTHGSRTCHYTYRMQWIFSLTWTNPTLQHGSSCTTLTATTTKVGLGNCSHPSTELEEGHFTTPPCVDSMTWQNVLPSNVRSM